MPNPTFSIEEAQLTGIFLESILFGVLLISYSFCLEALLFSRGRMKPLADVNWPMVIVSSIFLAVAIVDLSLGFYHLIEAFVRFKGPGGAAVAFADISNWINVTRSATFVVQTTIGDFMLIYRCWIVWNRSWRVIAPSIVLWLGTVAMTTWLIWIESSLHAKVLLNVKQLRPAGASFWVLSTVLNIGTTILLIYKIWHVEKQSSSARVRSTHRQPIKLKLVMRYIVESGVLYTGMELVAFVPFILGSTAFYPVTDAQIAMIGIVFNLIIIRTSKIINDQRSFSTCVESDASGSVPLHFVGRSEESTKVNDRNISITVTQDLKRVGDFTLDKVNPIV